MRENSKERIEALSKAVKYYKTQLDSNPNSYNRPSSLLNLAITNNQLVELANKSDLNNSNFSKFESVALLQEIETNYPNFEEIDKALYLKALTLQELERNEDALRAWEKLSSTKRATKLPVFGSMAAGDYYFDQDDPAKALRYFEKAKKQNSFVKTETFDPLDTKIEYRIAWAAYRNAEFDKVRKASVNLLSPNIPFFERDMANNIREDGVELLASALLKHKTQHLLKKNLKE